MARIRQHTVTAGEYAMPESEMSDAPVRLGVIGCGGFGWFAMQQFAQVPGVQLAAMAGTHRPAAELAVRRFGIPNVGEVERLVADPRIDLVYIATPPFLHHAQAMLALEAGKHVICEKPLALNLAQADEMLSLARARDRLLVANLMQRYNPVFQRVQRLIASQVLGEVLHGYFENYASDENLAAGPLVLGPGEERRDLHRARRTLLRPVRAAGWARARWWPPSGASGRARGSRTRSNARSATATASTSTSTTASTNPAGWTGRRPGWCSSGAT